MSYTKKEFLMIDPDAPAALPGATDQVTKAILALVEQQRIANLVALAALAGNTHIQESDFDEGATVASEGLHGLIEYVPTPATPFGGPDEYPTIRPEIKEALGLS